MNSSGRFFPLDIFARDAKSLVVSGEVYRHLHRVTYGECTVGNHVYYSRYLDILEEARGEFFRNVGAPLLPMQEAGTAFPVISVQIAYKGMARYDDLLSVDISLSELGGIRLTFYFRILNAAGAVLAEGETRHVCASIDEKPKRMPKELLEQLQPYLKAPDHAT